MGLIDFLNGNDAFAKGAGVRLVEVREGYARAQMVVGKEHLNAGGVCQGGALFTLADLAAAAVMNSHNRLTFSIGSSISFIKSAVEGELLTAEATEICDHRKLSCCEVKIRNGNGEIVCTLSGTGYRKEQPLDFASEA